MSDLGVKNRLDKAVEFLDAVMASQLAQKQQFSFWPDAFPLIARGRIFPRLVTAPAAAAG